MTSCSERFAGEVSLRLCRGHKNGGAARSLMSVKEMAAWRALAGVVRSLPTPRHLRFLEPERGGLPQAGIHRFGHDLTGGGLRSG